MDRIRGATEALTASRVDCEEASRRFEEASPTERVEITHAIDASAQARLWEATAGRAVSIAEMIPADFEPLRPVHFHGKNSLPLFSHFEKRFCRGPAGGPDELWGYNHQPTGWLAPLTGPGYFVAYDAGESVAVDYRRIPSERPDVWPELRDNRYRLSRFIYNGMIDYLRRISPHLLIGRATRDGKEMPNYFLLCREDPD
jgi:hypothetical protein